MFFFKNHVKNKSERLVPDLFLLFTMFYLRLKTSDQQLSLNIFWLSSTLTNNKSKFV